tara:strand:+ start:1561 stop:2685 length:1125 start_codon:yes stop_codon:yes gene_type:complete
VTSSGPLAEYQKQIESGDIKPDSVQETACQELQRLYEELTVEKQQERKSSLFQRMFSSPPKEKNLVQSPKGIYMHGGVGRGKSMLMDLFVATLPDTVKVRRVHFHEFMVEVHDYIHSRRMDDGARGLVDQALPSLAELITRRYDVLCFDEFHVTDITDAMILGRLFKILFENDLVVVATSNWEPDRLYEGGLQRELFLPFIKLLISRVNILHLDSPHDYRVLGVKIEGTYFSPLNKEARKQADSLFKALTQGLEVKEQSIEVKGRQIITRESADGIARFTFAELCERPHGAEDYLTITQHFHTVFLEDIPKLGYDRRNEAKRLMNLIDALYEGRRRVIITAAAKPEKLYTGHDHAFEFERTISRLIEMQSDGYP